MSRVYAFLGAAPHAANVSVLTKSISTPLPELVDNFAEVREALRGTAWERDPAFA